MLEREPDATLERERRDVVRRELEPAGAIEHGELLGDDELLAFRPDLEPPQRLGARCGRLG